MNIGENSKSYILGLIIGGLGIVISIELDGLWWVLAVILISAMGSFLNFIISDRAEEEIMSKKELLHEIERLEHSVEILNESVQDLEDFIRRNGIVCPKCGYSGLDCCNYQG